MLVETVIDLCLCHPVLLRFAACLVCVCAQHTTRMAHVLSKKAHVPSTDLVRTLFRLPDNSLGTRLLIYALVRINRMTEESTRVVLNVNCEL